MDKAGLIATVSATFPRKPAALARSCGVDPSDPMSSLMFRLLSMSSACHSAASASALLCDDVVRAARLGAGSCRHRRQRRPLSPLVVGMCGQGTANVPAPERITATGSSRAPLRIRWSM